LKPLGEWRWFHRFAMLMGFIGLTAAIIGKDVKGVLLMAFMITAVVPEDVLSRRESILRGLLSGSFAVGLWYVSAGWLRWAFLLVGAVVIAASIKEIVQKF
jgi:hypothetical protein